MNIHDGDLDDVLPKNTTGGAPKYPWAQWLDGQTRSITRGVDFFPAIATFRTQIHLAANRRGLRVRTSATGNQIWFQARPADAVAAPGPLVPPTDAAAAHQPDQPDQPDQPAS